MSHAILEDFGYFRKRMEPIAPTVDAPRYPPPHLRPQFSWEITADQEWRMDGDERGASWAEIAAEIGTSIDNAREIYRRAIRKLRRRPETMRKLMVLALDYRKLREERECA